jgi:hypothetical protein
MDADADRPYMVGLALLNWLATAILTPFEYAISGRRMRRSSSRSPGWNPRTIATFAIGIPA